MMYNWQKNHYKEIDLSIYPEPLLEDKLEVKYSKDKKEFEKSHMKILHSFMYITVLDDGTFDYQTEKKLKVYTDIGKQLF